MTFELNIRTLEAQVNEVRKDLKQVIQVTADDKGFRDQHEERLSKLRQEMLAVRQQVAKVETTQESSRVDFEECQKETTNVVEEFRKELFGLKESLDEMSRRMDALPTLEDLAESGYGSLPSDTIKTSSLDGTQRNDNEKPKEGFDTQNPSQSMNAKDITDIEHRIEAAIKSTRRWNRDHKTTKLADATFCANYLKQQSKRDAAMAVYIQKSIGKRIRRRLLRSRSRPSTLEEFCLNVSWQDVLDTVRSVLQHGKQTTIEEVRAQSS